MPMCSITRREGRLPGTVNDTIPADAAIQKHSQPQRELLLSPGRVPNTEKQPPADLNCGREVCGEAGNEEADESNENFFFDQLRREGSEAALLKMLRSAVHQRIRFVCAERRGKKLHHTRISIHAAKGTSIRIPPWAQQQARSGKLFCHRESVSKLSGAI